MQAITKLLAKERDLLDMMGSTLKPVASTADILDAAEAVLREAGDASLSSSVIWERLEEQGVYVGGKNPAANLSAKLSQAKGRFVSGGPALGWRLAQAASDRLRLAQIGSDHIRPHSASYPVDNRVVYG